MPNPAFDGRDEIADPTIGDGDPDPSGGDGDPTTGEPTTGEPTTGDGDGDPTTGDGDGDACELGLEVCADGCFDLDWDDEHCGSCTNVCGVDELCGYGICNRVRFAFVSTHLFSGAEASSGDAASKCTALAQDAGLPGSYRAWLSDAEQVPAVDLYADPVVFLRPDGWAIAWSWAELVGGDLAQPINLDQDAQPLPPIPVDCGEGVTLDSAVWTGTTNDGQPAAANCEDWSVESLTTKGVAGNAQSSELWSDAGCLVSCLASLPVYCVQD